MYFTYHKNYLVITASAAAIALSGCAHRPKTPALLSIHKMSRLDSARFAYENGEFYKSRVQVQEILNSDPDNTAAQQLMGDVLDKEISRHKEAMLASGTSASADETEEKTDAHKKEDVKTWLERSRTLLHQNQYDLALFAAEKVFLYDAENLEASLLIDDIKDAAIKNGKSESLFLSKMYKDEISERVTKYRTLASELAEQNKLEQARFTLQKILTLEPEDPDALKLFHELQQKEEAHA